LGAKVWRFTIYPMVGCRWAILCGPKYRRHVVVLQPAALLQFIQYGMSGLSQALVASLDLTAVDSFHPEMNQWQLPIEVARRKT
jgi:hypothetical protein